MKKEDGSTLMGWIGIVVILLILSGIFFLGFFAGKKIQKDSDLNQLKTALLPEISATSTNIKN